VEVGMFSSGPCMLVFKVLNADKHLLSRLVSAAILYLQESQKTGFIIIFEEKQ
jgi:hypothetical protein